MSLNIGNIGSTVKRAKGFVNSALGSVRSQAGKYTNLMGQSDASDGGGGNALLTYPSDLRAESNKNLPLIEFTAHERNPSPGQDAAGEKKPGTGFHTIYLPVTSSLVFSDSSNYNTINLSGAGAKIGQALLEGGRAPTDILTSMGAAVAEAKEMLAAEYIPGSIGDYIKFSSKTITNPNTNTTFEGNGIRTFSFTFKLVAKSEADSKLIQKIHQTFRYFSYADLNSENSNLFLSYPAPWTIKFKDSSMVENEYLPGIWSCYLTSVGTTFNSSSNMYFSDNAPTEVDISLTFQETRVLNRNDMMQIKKSPDRGIIEGKPSSITPAVDNPANSETTGEGGD
jgi:hypothetical protein